MEHEAVGYTCHFPGQPSGGHDLNGRGSSSNGECNNHRNNPQLPNRLCHSMYETAENYRSLTHEQLYRLMWPAFSRRLVSPSDMKMQKMDTHTISQYIGGAKFHDLENQFASLIVLFKTEQGKGTDRDREYALLAPQFFDEHIKK